MDSKQRDAGLDATGRTDLRRFPVAVSLFPADQLLLDVRRRSLSIPVGRKDFHGRQYQVEAVSHYRLGYTGSVYHNVVHRQITGPERNESGHCARQTLSLDGFACLRLVLPSPSYFGSLRERGVPLHDNVGADNEALVRDERGNSAIQESEQSVAGSDTAPRGDLRAGSNRADRGSGC